MSPEIIIRTLPLYNGNYGGVLQAYALQHILRGFGLDVATDSSRSDSLIGTKPGSQILNCKRAFLKLFPYSPFLRRWEAQIRKSDLASAHSDFIKTHINTVSLYKKNGNIRNKLLISTRMLLVGSDQVWRKPYGDVSSYLFDFAQNSSIIKASYAASFGRNDIVEYSPELKKNTAFLAKKLDFVSVRELDAVDICAAEWDIDAVQHIDPTLLIDASQYRSLTKNQPVIKNTLVSYMLDEDEAKSQWANNVAKSHGLNVSRIMPKKTNYKEYSKTGLRNSLLSIEAWINTISQADYVVTDSFHGVAFCIIFNRPFYAVINEDRGRSRFISLLKLLNLEDRLISDVTGYDLSASHANIDWDDANSRLAALRQKGLEYLQSLAAAIG